eukprot:TRINITY_DN3679_c0_g1_i1.p1 TRINITY_DN3679_c0_g1~~TRINITY_DN3679_c0_g1_i1.p1  ORF type:complete len:517 (-),score=126.87 TRINITY_DN3679_c0_g1_i1:697-2247(-)
MGDKDNNREAADDAHGNENNSSSSSKDGSPPAPSPVPAGVGAGPSREQVVDGGPGGAEVMTVVSDEQTVPRHWDQLPQVVKDRLIDVSSRTHPDQDPLYLVHHAFVTYAKLAGPQGIDIDNLLQSFEKSGNQVSKEVLLSTAFADKKSLSFEEFFNIYIKVHHEQPPADLFLKEWRHALITKPPVLPPPPEQKKEQHTDAEAVVVAAAEHKPKEISAIHDFLAGTVAGVILTLVGHPFDTVKVRLQTSTVFFSGIDCAMRTVRLEGPKALYRGMSGPLVTVPVVNAIIFGSYGIAKRWLQTPEDLRANKDLTITQHMIAGAFGGFASAVVISPIELVKTQLQVQYNRPGERALIRGPVECALSILRLEGVKGIYRGLVPTILREIPGYGGQFLVYESMKRILTTGSLSHVDNSKLGGKEMMLAGGIAGIGAWVFCYPQDVIKSRLQAGTMQFRRHRYLPDGGFIDAWKQVVAEQGYRGLWRGFATCCARAFPANAAAFLGYEATLALFHERNVSWW